MPSFGSAFRHSCTRELAFLRAHPFELALASWVPLLLVAIVAAALSAGVLRHIPIAVVDQDHSAASRELLRMLAAAPGLRIAERPADLEQARILARSARVQAVVFVPAGVEREVHAGRQATITALFNASYQTAGNLAAREIAATVGAFGARLAVSAVALDAGPAALRAPALAGRVTTLFNPEGSYEWNLVALVQPAILHLMLSLAVIAALGRELRDGSARAWLAGCGGRTAAALAGKLAPYVLVFTLDGVLCLLWLAHGRGWPVRGSAFALVLGQGLLYLAYAVVGVLVLGLVKRMSTALSLAGIYAGAGLAFCGGIFPTDGAPWFTRAWSALLPFTAYVKLQTQQLYIGAPLGAALGHLAVLAGASALLAWPAFALARRALRDPANWGLR